MKSDISIIVPVYNVKDYLQACVDSLTKQTVQPNEIILVDDGSTDGSSDLCDQYKDEFPNLINVVHQKNGGLSAARNTGIQTATSKYLLFVDSDDTIGLHACESFNRASNGKDADIIAATITSFSPDKTVKKKHSVASLNSILSGKDFLKQELENGSMFYASVHCMYDRKFLLENALLFVPNLLHEDQIFTIKAFLAAKRVINTNIEFYNHLIREGSITTQKNQLPNAISVTEICRMLESFCKDIEDYELKCLIMDHSVDLYYKAFIDANLVNHRDILLSKDYLIRNSHSKKNKLRTTVYCINISLLSVLEGKRRKFK